MAEIVVVGQFAVAALSERRNSLRIQDRWSETAATKIKLTHYRNCVVGPNEAEALRAGSQVRFGPRLKID